MESEILLRWRNRILIREIVYCSIKRKIKVMKTLNIVEKYTGNHGQINEIIEHNGSKFKIIAVLTNGTDKLYAEMGGS